MKKGRPKKFLKPVTVCIVIEEDCLKELDNIRGDFSRGEYLNILTISDNLKTQKILKLKKDVEIKNIEILSLKNNEKTEIIKSFQKTIHSNFRRLYEETLEKTSKNVKKFWAEKLGCDIKDLIDYL